MSMMLALSRAPQATPSTSQACANMVIQHKPWRHWPVIDKVQNVAQG
jgi:hypothetical protein